MKTMFETALTPSPDGTRPSVGGVRPGKIAELVAGHEELGHDLAGREIADELLRARVTERAGQRATHLARDAEGAAVALRDIDAFDLRSSVVRPRGRHPDEPFPGPVGRNLLGHDGRPTERIMLGEPRPVTPCRRSAWRRTTSHPGRRSNATVARPASASRARPRPRPAERPRCRGASCRRATASRSATKRPPGGEGERVSR